MPGELNAMRRIRAVAIASALLFTAMAVYTWPLKPGIPAIQLTFTESAFRSILAEWKPAGIYIFKTHFAIDFPFLVCYGALGYLISRETSLFERHTRRVRSLLALSLPFAAAADAIENSLHLLFLFGTGPFSQPLYLAAGIASTIKWLLIVGFVGSSAYALYKTAG